MKLQNDSYGAALSDDNLDLVTGGNGAAGSLVRVVAKGALRVALGPVALVAQILFTPSKLGDGTLKPPPAPKK